MAKVAIITRYFDDPYLGPAYTREKEPISANCTIVRLRGESDAYLEKSHLSSQLPSLQDRFIDWLEPQDLSNCILHAHFADAAILARAASNRFGLKWIYTPHSLARPGADPARLRMESTALATADAIITSSRDEAESQISASNFSAQGRVHRINPGVDFLDASPAIARARITHLTKPDLPVIFAVARPVEKKNLTALADAYARSPDLQKTANLVILAGQHPSPELLEPEEQQVLRNLSNVARRLPGKIHLPSTHTREELFSFYKLAAKGGCFVNPALHEPFGLTLIEAAWAGAPLVATRQGGPVDIIRELGAGHLVDPLDESAIARAIRTALGQPPTDRYKAQARAKFNWQTWAKRSVEIIAQLRIPPPAGPPAPPKLLVCDIDGTLTGDSARAAQFAVWRKDHPDVLFAVATGRSICEARRLLSEWALPLPDFFISSVGSEIWEWNGPGQLALNAPFGAIIAQQWNPEAILRVAQTMNIAPQPRSEFRKWKLSYFGDAATASDLRQALAVADLPAWVVFSHDNLIDVLPAPAGKAAAMAYMARQNGLGLDDCVAAGDSGNDTDMLEAAGFAILPANASAEIAHLSGPGFYRSAQSHAAGVLDGLSRTGLGNGDA